MLGERSYSNVTDGLNNVYVFTAGAVRKRRWEEDGDLAMVGGASLVSLFKENDPPSSSFKWSVGKGLLQFDTDVEALAKAGEYLNIWFPNERPPLLIIYIFSVNASALRTISNPQSKSHQEAVIHFHKALTLFSLSFKDTWIVLTWSPKNNDLNYDLQARTLTAEAALAFPVTGLKSMNTAAYQKSVARSRAF